LKRIAIYIGLALLGLIALIQVVAVLGAGGFTEKFVRLFVAGLIALFIIIILKKMKGS
jgi:hypothetical protein